MGSIFGDGVSIASRLQTLAEPDTICISQKVYEEIEKKIDLEAVVSLGQPQLKNIDHRFPVYALLATPPKGLRQSLGMQWLKVSRRVSTAHRIVIAGLVLALVSAGSFMVARRFSLLSPQHSVLKRHFRYPTNPPSSSYPSST